MKQNSKINDVFLKLYGDLSHSQRDLNDLYEIIENAKNNRKKALQMLDKKQKNWYFSNKIVGMTLYTDLFAGNLEKLGKKTAYFKELGINFIHLMPLLKPRAGENDGGYAVEDYRQIDARLGTLDDFTKLLDQYRKNNIYVCIDYVINHVAKENTWAQRALNHEKEMQDMFIMFDTSEIPDLYNQTVPEVLPDKCPGNFTYYPEIGKYVFTSFSDYQWDLNYKNPKVFNGMVEHMLYLANLGVNMIRLDAIPFMWKELGTTCRNLEPIHDLIYLLQLIKDEACPSVALLGEAIVEPHQIVKYFGSDQRTECEVMYNANLMVDIYNAFATRDVRLLTIDTNLHQIPSKGTWMNYLRCHDDIGWGFNESAIKSFGQDPHQHKEFLIKFYNNNFPNTFSNGLYYQFNPQTHDARTSGTLASLLGLEKASNQNELYKQNIAIDRIVMAHALILAYRGFPLIYSGDEIATLNDLTYLSDPAKTHDNRWVHRPFFDWKRSKKKDDPTTFEYGVYQKLKHLIALRKKIPFLHGQATQYAIDVNNHAIYCLIRRQKNQVFFALFNFSEHPQSISTDYLRQQLSSQNYNDVTQGRVFNLYDQSIELSPYEFVWCVPQ
jgi:amylosucrase